MIPMIHNTFRVFLLLQVATQVIGHPVDGQGILSTLSNWGQSCKSALNECTSSMKSSTSDLDSTLSSPSHFRSTLLDHAPEIPKPRPVCPICTKIWFERDFVGEWPTCTHNIAEQQAGKKCSICMHDSDEVLEKWADCDHSYHLNCAQAWLGKSPTCPRCHLDATPSLLSQYLITGTHRSPSLSPSSTTTMREEGGSEFRHELHQFDPEEMKWAFKKIQTQRNSFRSEAGSRKAHQEHSSSSHIDSPHGIKLGAHGASNPRFEKWLESFADDSDSDYSV